MRILCELYPDTMIMLMKEGIQNGITLEILMTKKHKKTPEEKAAVAKQKKQQMRTKLKKETRDNLAKEEILQDDRFFFIAGYTSGGAPYGITLEKMGLNLGMIWRKIKWCKSSVNKQKSAVKIIENY